MASEEAQPITDLAVWRERLAADQLALQIASEGLEANRESVALSRVLVERVRTLSRAAINRASVVTEIDEGGGFQRFQSAELPLSVHYKWARVEMRMRHRSGLEGSVMRHPGPHSVHDVERVFDLYCDDGSGTFAQHYIFVPGSNAAVFRQIDTELIPIKPEKDSPDSEYQRLNNIVLDLERQYLDGPK